MSQKCSLSRFCNLFQDWWIWRLTLFLKLVRKQKYHIWILRIYDLSVEIFNIIFRCLYLTSMNVNFKTSMFIGKSGISINFRGNQKMLHKYPCRQSMFHIRWYFSSFSNKLYDFVEYFSKFRKYFKYFSKFRKYFKYFSKFRKIFRYFSQFRKIFIEKNAKMCRWKNQKNSTYI